MAVVTENKRVTVSMKLNNGTTTAGEVKTLGVNLGNMNPSAFNAEKALNIANALGPCFNLMLHTVERTEVVQLIEE